MFIHYYYTSFMLELGKFSRIQLSTVIYRAGGQKSFTIRGMVKCHVDWVSAAGRGADER
jgi:hypothetical protein